MQDRFKYRFFDAENEKMYDVKNICFVGEPTVTVAYKPVIKKAIYKGYLTQCTGLKDVNGKLMYEGDIVKIWKFSKDLYGDDKRVIKWNDARCGFRLYTIDQYKRGIELCPQSMVNVTTIEVIGNIYENPELSSEVE